jgi:energy-coupling factor transporter ATP-binding protein EcfA2
MRLKRARVQNYKSIIDSGWVEFDEITCLVGKNESGKTAFLQALEKLNPVEAAHADFNYIYDYPASRYTAYKREHEDKPADVIEAEFELTQESRRAIEAAFGPGALKRDRITITKTYANKLSWRVSVDEKLIVQYLGGQLRGHSDALDAAVTAATDGDELLNAITAHGTDVPGAPQLVKTIHTWHAHSIWQGVVNALKPLIPRFFYFDDYSVMRGRISLDDLIRRQTQGGKIEDHERPFLALLSLIGTTAEELRDETHSERLTRELEGASNAITDEMFQFWTQNDRLEVRFELRGGDPNDPAPLNAGKVLGVRIYNPNHRATVPFDQRSKGFVWFFSFLVFFQELELAHEKADGEVVLLLDEPALSLHALAQGDFLRFMDERLEPRHQVVYTTHSPFMVDATKLDRVRTVTDRGKDLGTVVSDEVFRTDKDTVFPLQAALGYDLAQTLFVGPDNLLVEGPSDLIYLDVLNAAVGDRGGETLSERWVTVPVGGADKLYTFATLLGGNQLNAVALVDVSKRDAQRIANLQRHGHLAKNGLIQIGEITGTTDADIEDLFTPAFYLKLVNGAYAGQLSKKLTITALGKGNPRIAIRIEQHFKENGLAGGEFNHFRPAAYLLRNQAKLISAIDDTTLDRAEQLFTRINSTLSS